MTGSAQEVEEDFTAGDSKENLSRKWMKGRHSRQREQYMQKQRSWAGAVV